jgi:Concanavalin A-like lectin/glucanases superfamily
MSRGHLAAAAAAVALALAAPAAAHADSFPLAGWWPMNEGSGQTVRDWSGRGNNGYLGSTTGTDANDPSWVKGVLLGSALRFDGTDDFVTIPDSDSLEPQHLTVAAWVKGSGTPDHRYIVGKGANACSTGSWGLYTGEGGGAAFYIADSPSFFYRSPEASASAVWDGKWHHVAGTFDGSTVRFYLDGVQMGSGTPAPTTIDYSLPIGGGQIGSYPGTCSPALTLTGDIDGVQVWSQALPVDTIWNALRSLFNLAK